MATNSLMAIHAWLLISFLLPQTRRSKPAAWDGLFWLWRWLYDAIVERIRHPSSSSVESGLTCCWDLAIGFAVRPWIVIMNSSECLIGGPP